MKHLLFFLFLLPLVFLPGCSKKKTEPMMLDGKLVSPLQRDRDPRAEVREVMLSREEFTKALDMRDGRNRARLVKVFTRTASDIEYPEYRLFDVRPGSVYSLMRLQTADILVSAEGIAFSNQSKFFGYVSLLRSQESGEIEIRRNGEPVVFKYVFVDL